MFKNGVDSLARAREGREGKRGQDVIARFLDNLPTDHVCTKDILTHNGSVDELIG